MDAEGEVHDVAGLRDAKGHASPWLVALAWAAAYGVFSFTWILSSDAWVSRLAADAGALRTLQHLKGLVFAALTTALVFVAVWRTARRFGDQRQRLQDAAGLAERTQDLRWRHLVSNLGEFSWFSSVDGQHIDHVSPTSLRIYGRPPEAFLADPGLWRELVHPDDREALDASLRTLFAEGARTIEYRIRHADGRWRWLRDRAALLYGGDGRPIAIGGMAEDITAHRDARTQLLEREQQLSGIVETAMDAIITIDGTQRIRLFNQAASEMFRIAAPAALGRPLEIFVPPRLREVHAGHIERYAQTAHSSRRMGALQTLVGLRATGEEFPIEASISKMGSGEGLLMTVVLRDVTDRRDAERAQRARAEAEAASRAKTEFLSRMSHELRTPLNAILGFSQLLQTHPHDALSEHQRAQVEHIRQAGWHLLALINDVLDVSRIEAGRLLVETRSIDLHAVLDEAVLMSDAAAGAMGIVLEPAFRRREPMGVHGDPIRLRQVVLNLLSNAIKYNRPGGRVHIDVVREEDAVRLEIIDTGLGMSAQQMQHLYEPFNRLGRERGGVEGTGIGLALTRQLMALMQGRLEVESQLGRGTCVRAWLQPSDVPAHSAPAPLLDTTPGELDGGEPTPQGLVLYIEDNPVNTLVVEQLLSRWPLTRLALAEDGATGLALARSLRPDLVLLDMRLPDMNGAEVLAALRADAATAALRVVVLSASAMPEDIAEARRCGADDYWTKPLDFDRFLRDMQRLLRTANV